MNALSKVLVVLVLVLSVAFAVSQMVLHGKREEYGTRYLEAVEANNSLKAQNQKLNGERNDISRQLDEVRASKESEIERLQVSLDDEQRQTRELTKQNGALTVSVQAVTDRASKLETDLATRDEVIDGLRATVSDRDATIKGNLDNIDSLQGTLAARDATIGSLEHELTESQKAYRKLALSEERLQAIVGELVERGVHVPPAPLPVINGRVIRVDDEHGVAVVDKGGADGVRPNTEFTVYNDEGYVGRLVIHDVQPEVSAGRVRLLAENKRIEQGDKATTEIP